MIWSREPEATKTLARKPDIVAIRRTDGAMFEPSCPCGYTHGQALADALSGRLAFYFRRIVVLPRKWWQRRPRWKRTGEVWEPKTSTEFDLERTDNR